MPKPKSRDRPHIPDYGIEESEQGLLSWDWVNEIMEEERNYWVCTTNPDSTPHATPVWGIWFEDGFYYGGGPNTKRAKNLETNPAILVHSESKDNVVIVEGISYIEENELRIIKIQELYKEKYDFDHPPPFYSLKIKKVLAWKAHEIADYQYTPTRWKF